MRIPKYLYELYPFLYIFGGIAAISLVNSLVTFICGSVLTFAGISILFMRRNYRVLRHHIAELS